MKLGPHQTAKMQGLVLGRFQICPDAQTRALCKRGLLAAFGAGNTSDGFIGVTPAGLRWLADEIDAGRIDPRPKFPPPPPRATMNEADDDA